MEKVKICFISLLTVILLCGCNGPVPPETNVPKEGIWYCEELQAELHFDPPYGVHSSVTIDGKKLLCHVRNNPGTLYLSIYYQGEPCENYHLGEEIYWLDFVDRDEDEMVVKDHETGELYYFVHID